jgi:hypothetical protein
MENTNIPANSQNTSDWIRSQSEKPFTSTVLRGKVNIDDFLPNKDTSDKYKMFNNWCKAEGVKMPKLEYPAYFEDGDLLGVRATKDIQHKEAYLAVPAKLHMSVTKAKDHPVLGPIIAEYDIFGEQEGHRDHFVLTFFMIYEIGLGMKSYWYPYLRMLPDI